MGNMGLCFEMHNTCTIKMFVSSNIVPIYGIGVVLMTINSAHNLQC